MAFDNETRNRLNKMVAAARALLTDEFTAQLQETHGIQPDGALTGLERLAHLSDEDRAVSKALRERIAHLVAGHEKEKDAYRMTVERVVREQAFTVLNRFAALRMAEERKLVYESVRTGYQSQGFQVYLKVAGTGLGDHYHRYRTYLFGVFDEMAVDLGVIFDRFSPMGMLFPREQALLALLDLLNAAEIKPLWAEDETIGWIYQYFNSKEERTAMRDASAAPRNSRELAVRNQFFTPRYVVEFLTDNTLGRIWYDMTGGKTVLANACKFLVDEARSGQWSVDSGQKLLGENDGCQNVQGTGGVATSHGSGRADLLGHQGVSTGGNVRTDVSDQKGCGVGPVEHRRGAGPAVDQGVHQSSVDRLRVTSGSRNADPDRTAPELHHPGTILRHPDHDSGNRPTHQRPDNSASQQAAHQSLTTGHSPLTTGHRPLKDPREIKMLDPACGSMHFGLYAYDLYEKIYDEAWERARSGGTPDGADASWAGFVEFCGSFGDKESYINEVPRLILAHNIHGIDIDPRAVQIAGLTLWLRAHRSWLLRGIKPAARPRIVKSNIVCAEPMPGDEKMRQEFTAGLQPRVLGQLVEVVFDKMQLAGEAGSLLKIEEEIKDAIAAAKKQWDAERAPGRQRVIPGFADEKPRQGTFDLAGVSDEGFWAQAEERILSALREFAEKADASGSTGRRLFSEDAARGFAFIDLFRQQYSVTLMNPPFGACAAGAKKAFEKAWPKTKNDVYAAFVERGIDLLHPRARLGAITSRTGFFLSSFQKWREEVILPKAPPAVFVDLGYGVLDSAMVEVAAYCLETVASGQ